MVLVSLWFSMLGKTGYCISIICEPYILLSQNVFIMYYVILTQQLYFIGLDLRLCILQDLLRISNICLVQLILGSFLNFILFYLKNTCFISTVEPITV